MTNYTPAAIRAAFLRAAAHIEQHPAQFNFGVCHTPDCGAPGCALGWIGHFLGMPAGEPVVRVTRVMPAFVEKGIRDPFYVAMRDSEKEDEDWMQNAKDCANCMRRVADKFYPAESLPSWTACAWRSRALAKLTAAVTSLEPIEEDAP